MELLQTYLSRAAKDGASDLFFVPGAPVSYKLEGLLVPMDAQRLTTMHSEQLITEIYTLAERDLGVFQASGDDDFSFAIPGLARFRVNAYRQRGSWAAVIRVVAFSIPDWQELSIPAQIMNLAMLNSGMVLIAGTAGCGKSTTLACLIDRINQERACHVITLEDPIEYLHRNQKSIVSQRDFRRYWGLLDGLARLSAASTGCYSAGGNARCRGNPHRGYSGRNGTPFVRYPPYPGNGQHH